jgi:MazG family protein
MSGATGIDSGPLSKYLQTLRRLRLIDREVPVTASPKQSKRSRYRVADEFLRFWFRFVEPNRSSIEQAPDIVYDGTIEPNLPDHVVTTFEDICQETVWEAIRRGDIGPYSEVGGWWYGEDEIDIVGLAPDEDRILLAECKWTNEPVGRGLVEDLRRKAERVRWESGERAESFALFSRSGFAAGLRDELGDLLFQVVFHARIAEEQGAFDFHDVSHAIAEKIVRRHPHVFGAGSERDADTQTRSWEQIKAAERAGKRGDGPASELDGVPAALPALPRAVKLQQRAARVGFDWADWRGVFDKVHEELEELRSEVDAGDDHKRIEEEMGDLLFAMANLARHLRVNPETALRSANRKFVRRFQGLERDLADRGQAPQAVSREALEAAYERAKARDKESGPG